MSKDELFKKAKEDYFALCIAQVKALEKAPTEAQRLTGLHYSDGLKDGFIACLHSFGIFSENEIVAMELTGKIIQMEKGGLQ